jgi:N-acyl homoserine lactone hydrolase
MTYVKKLYVLLCGFEILPKSVCTRDQGSRFVLSLPISAYLLETQNGYILIDTGIDSAYIKDPVRREKYFGQQAPFPAPVVLPEHELLSQLQQIGVRPEEIKQVLISHLHADHTGNLKHFKHAKITLQARELEHALSSDTSQAYFKDDYASVDLDWDRLEGDYEVAPGIKCLSTPGHTPGHQSFAVDLPNTGSIILTADAGDLLVNFEEEILPGGAVDDEAALSSIRRLKREAQTAKGRLFLGHDPTFVQSIQLAPSFYD